MSPRATASAYARAIERALSAARGRPVVVSERDFALLSGWHARGVPLAVVLEALRAVAARGKVPRSLAYLAPAIEASWVMIAEGKASSEAAAQAVPLHGSDTLGALRGRVARLEHGTPVRLALERAIAAVERGEAPVAVDAALDDELDIAAPPELRALCAEEARRALAAHRDRMAPAVFEKTLRRAVADRLRHALGIPRLTPGG